MPRLAPFRNTSIHFAIPVWKEVDTPCANRNDAAYVFNIRKRAIVTFEASLRLGSSFSQGADTPKPADIGRSCCFGGHAAVTQ
ncbi:MAG: hypothetical protein NWS99_06360, partial [Paracoccaceae bacterium]|nr:hypothetical protein [Paracoccaceae bacterium]